MGTKCPILKTEYQLVGNTEGRWKNPSATSLWPNLLFVALQFMGPKCCQLWQKFTNFSPLNLGKHNLEFGHYDALEEYFYDVNFSFKT